MAALFSQAGVAGTKTLVDYGVVQESHVIARGASSGQSACGGHRRLAFSVAELMADHAAQRSMKRQGCHHEEVSLYCAGNGRVV
jgi:hypothetical protein